MVNTSISGNFTDSYREVIRLPHLVGPAPSWQILLPVKQRKLGY